jgi:hypothetical protein
MRGFAGACLVFAGTAKARREYFLEALHAIHDINASASRCQAQSRVGLESAGSIYLLSRILYGCRAGSVLGALASSAARDIRGSSPGSQGL